MSARARADKPLALLIAILVLGGSMIFVSAAFGLLGRGASHISSVAFNHLALGLGGGGLALLIGLHVPSRRWRSLAPYLFALSLLATAAVFVPHLGFEHGGGRRWLSLAGFTLQPSEFLKLGAVIMAAAYCAGMRDHMHSMRWGLGGMLAILAGPAIILLMQPDLGTLGIVGIGVASVFFAAGLRWRDMLILGIIGISCVAALAVYKPYVLDRVSIFLDPSKAPQAEGYQLRQSLIAIGSGGLFGRGFGQGVQKFTYLPEPMGDSIFAVAAEELGFIGAVAIVALFLLFALRGFAIGSRASDPFASLLAIGIASYLSVEAFINIGAMLGVFPLTGIPLTFISQGGSAMLASLASAGILLGVSRNTKR